MHYNAVFSSEIRNPLDYAESQYWRMFMECPIIIRGCHALRVALSIASAD